MRGFPDSLSVYLLWQARLLKWARSLGDFSGPILDPEDCLDPEPVDVCCDTCGAPCKFASGGPGVGAGCDWWEPAKVPPPVRPERVCRGRVDCLDPHCEQHTCSGWTGWLCEACGRIVVTEPQLDGGLLMLWYCPNACHWSECGRVVGCSPIGVTPTDRCSARMHDVFTGNDMAQPNHAPWPNPCAREGTT